MNISEMKTAEAVRQESLRDPEFRAEWDRTAFAEAVALRVTPSLDTHSRLASRLGITFHIDITPEGVAV